MGPLSQLLELIPGVGSAMRQSDVQIDDGELKHIEAIIQSMTAEERRRPDLIRKSRRDRIARGSGTQPEDVNALLKQFREMQKMMSQFGMMGGGGKKGKKSMLSKMPGGLGQIGNMRDMAKQMQAAGIDPSQLGAGGAMPPGMGGADFDALMGGGAAPLNRLNPGRTAKPKAPKKQRDQGGKRRKKR
jgi:signal recognition particle subunit SRP54